MNSLTRVIPCLLISGGGLVKTTRFSDPRYLGDPINAVRIFNDKEVDELVILDIAATSERRGPDLKMLRDLAAEAFMPFAYGGGIRTTADAESLFALGIEKVIVNTAVMTSPNIIENIAAIAGSSSVVGAVDVRRDWLGRARAVVSRGRDEVGQTPSEWAMMLEQRGVGELLLTFMDRDGTMNGYDLEQIQRVSSSVSVPVIACGGAGSLRHMAEAREAGASAVAAGSMFVYHGKHKAVLISYPSAAELESELFR